LKGFGAVESDEALLRLAGELYHRLIVSKLRSKCWIPRRLLIGVAHPLTYSMA
jgi:hypothetical protein